MFTNLDIAQVVHEANLALQRIDGDPVLSPHWADADQGMVDGTIATILAVKAGATVEQMFETWSAGKRRDGWTWGADKDAVAKTHPCLVPTFADLPPLQQMKDRVFHAIVHAMTGVS